MRGSFVTSWRPGCRSWTPALRADLLLWWPVLASPVVLLAVAGAAGWPAQAGVVVAVTGAAALLARSHPLVPPALVAATSWIDVMLWPLAILAFLAGLRSPRGRPASTGLAVSGAAGVAVALLITDSPGETLLRCLALVGLLVLPWTVGRFWRAYRELVHSGWERAESLERERRVIADRERLRERARIAEDMHDSLGHELGLIAMRAGVLEVAPGLGEEDYRAAAAELRAGATRATERLQEIIGILHEGTGSDPGPLHRNVDDLVDRARSSGMAIDLEREGAEGEVPEAVDRAMYRVVQESLTNAAKHAPGAKVRVRLRHLPDETVISVVNGPPPGGPPPSPPSGNRGLAGVAERVRLAGGTLRSGPRDGGFEVVAHLPHVPGVPPVAAATAEPETESALRRARVHRRLRRDLVTMTVLPAALSLTLVGTFAGYAAVATASSVLPPEDYARLRIGQPAASVEEVLPRMQMLDPPSERGPAIPEGARCEYYRSHGTLLGDAGAVAHRLCFADGVLVAKAVIPYGGAVR
ncbi:sensor histidine kinase [Marinactinospora thermotolerans]|uniref:sensor histidine kinase n=1 Tax=Marinactinospora thermotolerans TaxID=531310 RepID=UPI001185CDA2|nr:sensor histidine kinase [Marinactinospora thermotolerans]